MEQLYSNNALEEITRHIQSGIDGIVWGIPEKTFVYVGNNIPPNWDYINANNISVIRLQNEGGTIITQVNDFDIGVFSHDMSANDTTKEFMVKVKNYLIGKGLNASLDGNDLMVDGFKCGSWSSRRFGTILYASAHISISMDLELVQNICMKPMKKVPKGLSDFGITTNEIKSLL